MVASLLYMCLLSGCSRRTIDNDVSGGAPDELREDVKQEEDNYTEPKDSPPMILSFDNIEQYKELISSESMSDDIFDKYIRGTDYYWNGIETKDDLKNFHALMDDVLLPESIRFDLSEITVYPESGLCFLRYSNNVGYVCDFTYYLVQNTDINEYYNSLGSIGTALEIELGEESCISKLYYITEHEYDEKYSLYYMTINGCVVVCRVHGHTDYESSYGVLNSFVFISDINR